MYPRGELDRALAAAAAQPVPRHPPGTSLADVHETTASEHRDVVAGAEALCDAALNSIARAGEGAALNLTGFARTDVVDTHDGLRLVSSPAFGLGGPMDPEHPVSLEATDDLIVLDNGLITAALDQAGRVVSLRRVGDDRELLARPAGYTVFDDRPTAFDAWELEPYYREVATEVDPPENWRTETDDKLRCEVVFEHQLGDRSRLEHRVRLDANSGRLGFCCRVDWRERNRLLKFVLPLVVRAERATYGAQFGVHELSTHQNTDTDLGHFEAPALGFVDLAEHGLGATLLSSTSHGFGVLDGEVSLSLLRAAADPDPNADQGDHELRFAIQPHGGDWRAAGVVQAAEALANPQRWLRHAAPGGAFARVDGESLAIDALKRSEEGDALVLRLHEPYGARGTSRLHLSVAVAAAHRTNALEDPPGEALARDGEVVLVPYRPFELITLRLALAH